MRINFWHATSVLAALATTGAYSAMERDWPTTQFDQVTPVAQAEELPPDADVAQELDDCVETLNLLPPERAQDPRLDTEQLIVVFKRTYKVGLYRNGKLVTEDGVRGCFPISMGPWPFEPKYRYDNASTPEGWYFVGYKGTSDPNDEYRASSFAKSLMVSYPNRQDIALAQSKGVIDDKTAKELRRDVEAGRLPRQNSPMGGAILIHSWFTEDKAATAGCVGVDDDNMDWLFARARPGDPILILPWRRIMFADGTFGQDDRVHESLDEEIDWEEFTKLVDIEASEKAGGYVLKPYVITAR